MNNPCPDDERLADYLDDRLCAEDRFKLEEHFSECELCLEVLAAGKNITRSCNHIKLEQVPEQVTLETIRLLTSSYTSSYHSILKKVKDFINRIGSECTNVFNTGFWGITQPAMVRGQGKVISEGFVQVKKKFNDIHTVIEIEKADETTAHIRVILIDPIHNGDVRVSLMKEDREISSMLLNSGNIVFENIPHGAYRLIFVKDGIEEKGNYSFEVR